MQRDRRNRSKPLDKGAYHASGRLTCYSPSPWPSPLGIGNRGASLLTNQSHSYFKNRTRSSLSPGERVGARGKGAFLNRSWHLANDRFIEREKGCWSPLFASFLTTGSWAARIASLTLFLVLAMPLRADLVPVPALGLRVTRGFQVTQFAGADLANDIYAMTLDARGNVVVTSQGYIKTLLDTDGDGRADTVKLFAST